MGIQNSITNKCDSLNVTTTATIGTGATVTTGDVQASAGGVNVSNIESNTNPAYTNFYKSRAGGAITTGDDLGSLAFYGHDGTNFINTGGIRMWSSGTIGPDEIDSNISFNLRNSGVTREVARIDSQGTLTLMNTGASTTINTSSRAINIGHYTPASSSYGAIYFHRSGDEGSAVMLLNGTASTCSIYFGQHTTRIPNVVNSCVVLGNEIAQSGSSITTSIAVGPYACHQPQAQISSSVVIGNNAMRLGGGSGNVSIGQQSCYSVNGNNNTGIGHRALYSTITRTGTNTCCGAFSMSEKGSATTGGATGNTAIGAYALQYIIATGADNNTAVGHKAGAGYGYVDATHPANNTFIGAYAGDGATGGSKNGQYNVLIGYQAGYNLASNESNNIFIGNSVLGTATESNVLRIGKATGTSTGELNKAFISGIYGISVGATAGVAIVDSDNQVGTLSGLSGTVLMGGTKPAFSTTTYPSTTSQGDIIYASADNTLAVLAKSTDSTRYLSNTGSDNNPAWEQIDLSDGVTGVLSPANGGAITWEEVTGTTKTMEVSHAYIANNASQVVFTLPATAALGTIITVQGLGSGEWKIEQNADQQIHVAGSSTTVGETGYVEADARYDSITMVCVVADEEWVATSYIGTLTVA